MYSASLLSFLAHDLYQVLGFQDEYYFEGNEKTLVDHFDQIHELKFSALIDYFDRSSIPVAGRTYNMGRMGESFGQHVEWSSDRDSLARRSVGGLRSTEEARFGVREGQSCFWGRVPLRPLINHLRNNLDVPAEKEFLDLGVPLRFSARGGGGAALCRNWLKVTKANIKFQVAIIDRGKTVIGGYPNDFNGKLTHVETNNVEMSPHAEEVLAILLSQLNVHGLLPECEVFCGLVKEARGSIGRKCFKHQNVVEIMATLSKLDAVLDPKLPVFLNMSLGCHVGPHNGQSPLETQISQMAQVGSNRYFHVSVGNDGGTGVAAIRHLVKGVNEYLRLRTGPSSEPELLVEFWWEDTGSPVTLAVEISDSNGVLLTPTQINSSSSKTFLTRVGPTFTPSGTGQVVMQSLYHARSAGNWNCIAFAMTTRSGGLPPMDVDFTLSSSAAVTIEAWVSVCEDPQTLFVDGLNERTVCVPATSPDVISVAGIQGGQPWRKSSRGWDRYQSNGPVIAHDVDSLVGVEEGTSFASPRACADTAQAMLDPTLRRACVSVSDVVLKSLPALPSGNARVWNARTGYGNR